MAERVRGGRALLTVVLGVAAFGLYALTMGDLQGYEPETAAVSQSLIDTGQLRIEPSSSLFPPAAAQGIVGRGGRLYGRQGLTQPLLEAPFYWVGLKLDELGSGNRRTSARMAMLRLYSPLMAAITVGSLFLLLVLRGVPERRALLVASVAAVGSLIWPYSKIGMDTTLMATLALAFASSAAAASRPTGVGFALVGVASGLAINSKPYGVFLLIGLVPILWRPLLGLSPRERARLLSALLIPVAIAVAAGGWYNWYRTGSATNFMNTYVAAPVAAPINAAGLFVSPGKGLLFYSPLVILGLLGLLELRRADPRFALAIVLTVIANTVVVAVSLSWTDETWGPRYMVPSAWLLLVPIAWWARGRRRIRWLRAVATVGVTIQVAAILTTYGDSIPVGRELTGGEYVYLYGHDGARVAYGDDGPRWIPGASPLLFQLELGAAYLKEQLTGSGFVVTYQPYRGVQASIDLRHPETVVSPLPAFWWASASGTKIRWLAPLLAALALGSAAALSRAMMPRGGRHHGGPSSACP